MDKLAHGVGSFLIGAVFFALALFLTIVIRQKLLRWKARTDSEYYTMMNGETFHGISLMLGGIISFALYMLACKYID